MGASSRSPRRRAARRRRGGRRCRRGAAAHSQRPLHPGARQLRHFGLQVSSSCTLRHHSALLTSAAPSAAQATIHAHGGCGRARRRRRRQRLEQQRAHLGGDAVGLGVDAGHQRAAQLREMLAQRAVGERPAAHRAAGSSATLSTCTLSGVKLDCSPLRRSGTRCSWYSTLETSAGLICFGSTPTAPSARAWPRYSSPSCEVYIMIGMVAVRGSFLMACTACRPSMPGIR